jgi:AhpD family alkylhydroperoxidase
MNLISESVDTSFNKRIYTYSAFKADVELIFDHLDDLRQAARSGSVGKAFAEKIMLVVTGVNGCRYCSYAHSRAALSAGVPEIELQRLLALDLGTFPEDEVIALTFAQHFAESRCCPDPAAWERLTTYYGNETANDILAYLRMITFGNLLGNTFDALLSRIVGKPAQESSLLSELGVLLGIFWVIPSRLLLRLFNRDRFNLVASQTYKQN